MLTTFDGRFTWKNSDFHCVKKFIENLLSDSNSSLNYYSVNNSVTLLTTLLAFVTRNELEKEIQYDLICKLIKNGINVESSVSDILGGPSYYTLLSIKINQWKHMLQVPDALLISFAKAEIQYVEIFLPYWWAPPLVLLIFAHKANIRDMELWLPVLLKYGGIPHGTKMFKAIKEVLQAAIHEVKTIYLKLKSQEFQDNWQTCLNYLASPLSLQELCKYKVREMLADKASQPDTRLPTLLHDLLPPLLRPVVIH